MAYIKASKSITTATGVTIDNSAVEMPDHEAGDLLVHVLLKRRAGDVAAAQGWTNQISQVYTTEAHAAIDTKVAASSSELWPNYSGGQSFTAFCGFMLVIADYDGTTPIDVVGFSTATAGSVAAPALTTTTDGALIITGCMAYFSGSDAWSFDSDDMVGVDYGTGVNAPRCVGYTVAETAGAIPTPTLHGEVSAPRLLVSIAINNSVGGTVQPYLTASPATVAPNRLTYLSTLTVTPPQTILGATYDGFPTSALAISLSNKDVGNIEPALGMTQNASDWLGGILPLGSALDVSTDLLAFTYGAVTVYNLVDALTLVIADSLGNWRTWQLRDSSNALDSVGYPAFVDCTQGFYLESATAPDLTDITHIGAIRRSSSSANTGVLLAAIGLIPKGSVKIVGGGANYPINALSLKAVVSSPADDVQRTSKQGVGQIVSPVTLQIGDGTLDTYCDFGGTSYETPVIRPDYAVSTTGGYAGILFKTKTDDTVILSDSIIASSVAGVLEIDAASVVPATWETSGLQVRNYEIVWNSSFPIVGTRFIECHGIDFKSASLTNCAIVNQVAGHTALCSDGASFTDTDFETDTASNYALTIGAAGTFSFDGTTFTGYTTDINITAATGTVTLSLAAGQATPTYTTAGATVVISSPAVVYTRLLPNILDGATYLFRNDTTSTNLVIGTTSGGTGIGEAFTEGTDFTAGDSGLLTITYQSGTAAKETIVQEFSFPAATSTESSPTTMADQASYNMHGVDGSLVPGITWDSGNLQFDFNDADNTISGQDIAAWYYYFITTATGIAEAAGAIQWNELNKVVNCTDCVGIKFDNTKATPLIITDTWISRSDGASIIAATSNSIQIDPPAVFVATVAGASVITGDIADVAAEVWGYTLP